MMPTIGRMKNGMACAVLWVSLMFPCVAAARLPKADVMKRVSRLLDKVTAVSRASEAKFDRSPYDVAATIVGDESDPTVLSKVAIMTAHLYSPGWAEDQNIDQYLEPVVWVCMRRVALKRDPEAIDAMDTFHRSVLIDGAWALWYDELLVQQGRPSLHPE